MLLSKKKTKKIKRSAIFKKSYTFFRSCLTNKQRNNETKKERNKQRMNERKKYSNKSIERNRFM